MKKRNAVLETETGVGAADNFIEYELEDYNTDYLENLFKFLMVAEKTEGKKKTEPEKKWSV